MHVNIPKKTVGRCRQGDRVKLVGSGDTREFSVGGDSCIALPGYINLMRGDSIALIVARSNQVHVIKEAPVELDAD